MKKPPTGYEPEGGQRIAEGMKTQCPDNTEVTVRPTLSQVSMARAEVPEMRLRTTTKALMRP